MSEKLKILTPYIDKIMEAEAKRLKATNEVEKARGDFRTKSNEVARNFRPFPENLEVAVLRVKQDSPPELLGRALLGNCFIRYDAFGECCFTYCLYKRNEDGSRSRFRFPEVRSASDVPSESFPFYIKPIVQTVTLKEAFTKNQKQT